GQFLAYSVFGRSGGARSRSEQGELDAHAQPYQAPPPRGTEIPPPDLFQFRLPQQNPVQADEIKRLAASGEGSFLKRYPHALASNQLIGAERHTDITTLERVQVTAPRDERFADVTSTVDSTTPRWMQPYTGPESINYARRMEELDPHIRTADLIAELSAARLLTPADREAVRQAHATLQAHPVRPIFDANDPHSYLLMVTRDGTWNDARKMVYDTNPAILTNDLLIEGDSVERLYLRGVGTDGVLDSLAGGATGDGSRRGIDDQLRQLREKIEDIRARDPEAHISVVYTGFSRGAFAMRDLANQAERMDLPIDQSAMLVYDTVGSMGAAGNDINPGYDVHTRRDMQVLHLTADDEQRAGFPLTSIHTSRDEHNPNWVEIGMPGAHSELGGGYLNDYSRIPLQFGHEYLQRLGVPLKPLGDFSPPSLDSPALLLHDSRYLPYSSPRDVYHAAPLTPPSSEWKGGFGSGKGL
ncbi:phospholipase effector Tle1 domain-containing protein, partial [Lysobacter panacisoli]